MHWLGETLVTRFNFPIMVIASAAFVTRALDSTIFLELSASRQLFTIFFITKVQACVRTAAAYLHFFVISLVIIVYVFVFQNIIIEGRNFYVFTIFRVSQLVFVPLKRLLFLEFSVQNFLLPTANLLIIPGTLFVSPQWWYQLFLMELTISTFWNMILNCCSFLTLMRRWHQALIKKFKNLFLPIFVPI